MYERWRLSARFLSQSMKSSKSGWWMRKPNGSFSGIMTSIGVPRRAVAIVSFSCISLYDRFPIKITPFFFDGEEFPV